MINAGHPPPLLVPPVGSPRYLELEAHVPLGTLPDALFQSSRLTVDPGSMLVFFTDGLVESVTVPLQEGLDRLLEVVGAAVEAKSDGIDGLSENVISEMAPDRAHDDIAVLGVRIS